MRMTAEEALRYQKELFDDCIEIVQRKRVDYSGGDDPFRNFRSSEVLTGVPTWQGVLVRLGDKFSRLRSILERGGAIMVKDETLRDTICDTVNYICILGCLIEEMKYGDTED